MDGSNSTSLGGSRGYFRAFAKRIGGLLLGLGVFIVAHPPAVGAPDCSPTSDASSGAIVVDDAEDFAVEFFRWQVTGADWGDDHIGPHHAYAEAAPGHPGFVTFAPDLGDRPGRYRVAVRYPRHPPGTVSTFAVIVHHRDGATWRVLDGRRRAGVWVELGEFDLHDGDYVEFPRDFAPAGPGRRVPVDAVRFCAPPFQGGQPSPMANGG